MTKEEALNRTKAKFTNLLDNKVLSSATVSSIIGYYEGLLTNQPQQTPVQPSGIMRNFINEQVRDMEDDDPYYSEW